VSNVNRARSLENSFPRGKIIFELVVVVVDRHFGFRMSRTHGSKAIPRTLLYIRREETVEKTAEIISDFISRSKRKKKFLSEICGNYFHVYLNY